MATYTQGVDPQSFAMTPYQLPVNQIIQAVATRNAYWDAGASRLKNMYGQISGMGLTLEQNKQELNKLMKGVDAGLNQAVHSDLSIAPNVSDAMKVFDPVVRNENINGDRAITSHYQKQMQIAESARTNNGGKEWSPVNVKDVMIGLDKFAKSGDPNLWREHYAQRRSYTPYVDVQAEIQELRSKFKPSVMAKTEPSVGKDGKLSGLYLTSTIDKSETSEQWKAYLSANLSDKARNQLAINGRVAFYEREPELIQAYGDYTQKQIDTLTKQRQILSGAQIGTKDKLTPEMKDLYDKQLGELDNQIQSLQKEKNKLDSGDPSTLADNQDGIAALVYSDNYLSNVARSLQNTNIQVDIKPDAAAIAYMKEQYADNRLALTLNSKERIAEAQLQMERLRLAAAGDKDKDNPENFIKLVPGLMNAGPDDNKDLSLKMYEDKLTQYKQNADNALTTFYDYMENIRPGFHKLTPLERQSAIQSWVENNRNDEVYRRFKDAHDIYNNQKAVKDQIVDEATEDAKRNFPSIFKADVKAPDVTLGVINQRTGRAETIKISGDEVKNITLGISKKYRTIQQPTTSTSGGSPLLGTNSGTSAGSDGVIEVDGGTYRVPLQEFAKLNQATNSIREITGGKSDKVAEAVNSKVTESLYVNKIQGDQYKQTNLIRARQDFAREFDLSKDEYEGTTVYGVNQLGTYYNLNVDKDKRSFTDEQLKKIIESKGGKVTTLEGHTLYFMPHEAGTGALDNYYSNPKIRPIEAYFEWKKTKASHGAYKSPAAINYDPNNIGEAFGFQMILDNGTAKYAPIHKNTGKQIRRGGTLFNSLQEAVQYLDTIFPNREAFDEGIVAY